eukprot:PhM_4_TR9446/c0_g1_i1/m.9306/K04459/DUSP, MKP; dual specificity MAP kinase phosphatase
MSQKKGRPTISLDVSAAVRQHRPVVLVEANNNNTNTNSANGNHHAQHCVAPCSCSSHPAGWSSGLSVSGTAMPIHPQQPQHTLDFNATRVLDHLYLGSFSDAMQRADMVELGIRYILNVARECDTDTDDSEDGMTPGGPSFRYLKLALKDHSDEDIGQHFHAAIEFIEEARRSGGKVLVHCRQGVSRSPTIVLAYIMRAYSMSLSEALQLVQAKRDSVCPNIGFILALEEFEPATTNAAGAAATTAGTICGGAALPNDLMWNPKAELSNNNNNNKNDDFNRCHTTTTTTTTTSMFMSSCGSSSSASSSMASWMTGGRHSHQDDDHGDHDDDDDVTKNHRRSHFSVVGEEPSFVVV